MRTYTPAQKAEAIALSATIGDRLAAERLGLPRRNINYWRAHPGSAGEVAAAAVAASRDDVAAKLWQAVTEGTDQILRRIRDPKARLSDVAQALRVVAEQHALLTGGPTSNNFNVNVDGEVSDAILRARKLEAHEEGLDEVRALVAAIRRSTDDEIRAEMPMVAGVVKAFGVPTPRQAAFALRGSVTAADDLGPSDG